jgi:hypothetical protein
MQSTTAMALQGTPPTDVTAGRSFSFQPAVKQALSTVAFSIQGKPAWASFDATTGQLSGTPGKADVGVTADIKVSATDGTTSASVGPFALHIHPLPGGLPVMRGTPATSVMVGQAYDFRPTAFDGFGVSDWVSPPLPRAARC